MKLRKHAKSRMIQRYGNIIIPRIAFCFAKKTGTRKGFKTNAEIYKIGRFKYLVENNLIQTFVLKK